MTNLDRYNFIVVLCFINVSNNLTSVVTVLNTIIIICSLCTAYFTVLLYIGCYLALFSRFPDKCIFFINMNYFALF